MSAHLPASTGVCQRCRRTQGVFHADVFPEGYYCEPCTRIVAAPNRKRDVQAYHTRVAARQHKEALDALAVESAALAYPQTPQTE